MLQIGKVQLLGQELERNKVGICGLSEVRWEGQGHFITTEGHTMIYSGRDVRGMYGVAVWLDKDLADALMGYETVSERIIGVRINLMTLTAQRPLISLRNFFMLSNIFSRQCQFND